MPENIAQMPESSRSDHVEDDEVSLFELAELIWTRKIYILVSLITAMIVSVAYLVNTRDIYRAEASIMPLQGRSTIALPSNLMGIEGLKEMIGENMPGLVEAPNSSKIRSLITGRRLNLMLVERFDLLPILFRDGWDMSQQHWKAEINCSLCVLAPSGRTLLGANRRASLIPTAHKRQL